MFYLYILTAFANPVAPLMLHSSQLCEQAAQPAHGLIKICGDIPTCNSAKQTRLRNGGGLDCRGLEAQTPVKETGASSAATVSGAVQITKDRIPRL